MWEFKLIVCRFQFDEKVAIIGSGNAPYLELLRVPLSSIDQQSGELGRRTAQQILRLIESKTPLRPEETLLEPKLVIRASSSVKSSHS